MILSYHCIMQMIRAGELVREIKSKLEAKFGHEASSLSTMLVEEILGISKTEIILNTAQEVETSDYNRLFDGLQQLMNDVPIQHILGYADFYGRRFKVSRATLVPRQETEELVNNISGMIKENGYSSLLDIGTGTGCIAISLALEHKMLDVSALDISLSAIEIARLNTSNLQAQVHFLQADIFNYVSESSYDVIISNPPYVLESEKSEMSANVLNYDPALALFVKDEDPMIFYARITEIAQTQLNQGGLLYFEINEKFGNGVSELLKKAGFEEIVIVEDLNGKERFVYGFKK